MKCPKTRKNAESPGGAEIPYLAAGLSGYRNQVADIPIGKNFMRVQWQGNRLSLLMLLKMTVSRWF